MTDLAAAVDRIAAWELRPVAAKTTPPRSIWLALAVIEADRRDVSLVDVTGRCRSKAASEARFAVWARMRARGYSLQGIGFVSGRDHTTIMFGIRRASGMPGTRGRQAERARA